MAIRLTKNPVNIQPIYSPRTSYKRIKEQDERMIADMTLNFDKLTINLLREEFSKHGNVLYLNQFITIASKHLRFWQVDLPNRQTRLVRYLTYLFNQIDINGNGDMEWQEFTNYIIEKATVLKNLKSKNDQIKHYIKSQVAPKVRIEASVQKVQYLPDLDKIAYYEEGSNVIYFVNADNGQLCPRSLSITPKQLVVNISSVKKEKTGKVSIRKKDLVLPTNVRVLDILYLPDKKYRLLLVATSDGYVRGWKYTQNGVILATQPDNQEQAFEHHFPFEIYCLSWDSINEVLYCGQKNGGISMWNLKTDLQKTLTEGKEQQGGQEKANLLVTSMITMPKLQFMASGRMDGKLVLWDTINSKKKWIYKEHTRGILSLAFNETMILLFSAGFDHKICIWNPYIPSLIHKIEGHLSPVLSLKVVENAHQLISLDSEGVVKITDTRRFNIISSFSVEPDIVRGQIGGGIVNSFIAINRPNRQGQRLVFAGKSIWFYDYDKNYNPTAADEHTVISCRYVKQTLSFFTPSGNKIKVWSALNGDIQKIYMDITSFEISAFDFDSLRKRMVIGDTRGNIALYNTANGARMKALTRHTGEVTHLIATMHPETKADIFISCGLDNQIRVSRQTEESFEIVRTIYIKKELQITCLKFCPQSRLIMVGTSSGSLAFFDIETGKHVGSFCQDPPQELTSVTRATREVVILTSSASTLTILGLPPCPYRFQQMFSIKHGDPEKEGAFLGLRLSCYNQKNKLLYVIDDKMYLSCYDLNMLFSQLDRSEANREKIQFQRKNLIKQALNRTKIQMKWQVKAHTETVKVLEYVEQAGIIITSSYDRKVKIWHSETGQYIDSLQQNYNKPLPEPLAYYDLKKHYLYTKDRKRAYQTKPMLPQDLEFNPFLFQHLRKGKDQDFPSEQSNKEWNLQIDFKGIVSIQRQNFDRIYQSLKMDISKQPQQILQSEQSIKLKKTQILQRKREMMKQIRCQKSEQQKAQVKDNEQRKYSTNYFRRSMIKCIQNFVDKNQSIQLMQHLKSDKDKVFGKKKHFDYIPIYKIVNQTQKTIQEMQEHKQYVLDLAKKDTLNILNSRKHHQVLLSKQESDAANRLYRMLKTTEGRTNHIPITYLSKDPSCPNLFRDSQQSKDTFSKQNQFSQIEECYSDQRKNTAKSGFHMLYKQKGLPRID